jgi:Concanavalin A-like lectin/glucanases superfamily
MKKIRIQAVGLAALASFCSLTGRGQSPFYSVNGLGGTGGGTAGVTLTPGVSPSGSSALTDLGGTTQFTFGTGPTGVAGESIVNGVTGQAGAGVLAGTLGASSSMPAFTLTMWFNMSAATANNYRLFEISPGATPSGSTADGTLLFFGLNSGGGLQGYVNNVNGNSTATDIATVNTWNNGGTLGALTANKWYFVALTYDTVAGTSLLYSGDQTSSATLAYTFNNTSGGVLDLTSATSVALLDRFSGGRDFPGAIDNVNLYNGALTPSQIDAIQAVPEPSFSALTAMGGILGLIAINRRRRS